jgi:hypothetical protein
MPPADSFGPHETAGQPYDRPGAEGIRESNRIAYGLMWCFLESVGKDDEFAWTVGERALIESESILLGETVGPRWRGVISALSAEAAGARWRLAGSMGEAMADIERKIAKNS